MEAINIKHMYRRCPFCGIEMIYHTRLCTPARYTPAPLIATMDILIDGKGNYSLTPRRDIRL